MESKERYKALELKKGVEKMLVEKQLGSKDKIVLKLLDEGMKSKEIIALKEAGLL